MPILFVLAFIILVIILIATKKGGVKPSSHYKKRPSVMNSSERELYLILKNTLADKFIILSKVRIEDFVDADNQSLEWRKRQSLRGRIKSRHVDFLICNLFTTEPLYAIELDGYSHRGDSKIERDIFVDELYKNIGLPIEHIRVGSNFADEVERIKNLLITK